MSSKSFIFLFFKFSSPQLIAFSLFNTFSHFKILPFLHAPCCMFIIHSFLFTHKILIFSSFLPNFSLLDCFQKFLRHHLVHSFSIQDFTSAISINMVDPNFLDFSSNPSNLYYIHPNENPTLILVTLILGSNN